MSDAETKKISRRDFLKLSAAGAMSLFGWIVYKKINKFGMDEKIGQFTNTATNCPPTTQPNPTSQIEKEMSSGGTPTPDIQTFMVIEPQLKDSLGGQTFKEFIGNGERLVEAWTVPSSIYAPFMHLDILRSIDYAPAGLLPRWSRGEANSVEQFHIEEIVKQVGHKIAFVIDSGGAHSFALAAEAARHGWQPVINLREVPCSGCANAAGVQSLGAALYSAAEMEHLLPTLKPDAPPAFVWNSHRQFNSTDNAYDNNYQIEPDQMPSGTFLREHGVDTVVYIDESCLNTIYEYKENNQGTGDWRKIIETYQGDGLAVYRYGVPPWVKNCSDSVIPPLMEIPAYNTDPTY